MPTHNASASFRFSTDDLLETARAKVVRELHEQRPCPAREGPSRSSHYGIIVSVSTSPSERCLALLSCRARFAGSVTRSDQEDRSPAARTIFWSELI